MINCPICKNKEDVKFLDDYKLEIKEDKKIFKDAEIYASARGGVGSLLTLPTGETKGNLSRVINISLAFKLDWNLAPMLLTRKSYFSTPASLY